MRRIFASVTLVALLVCSPNAARADVELDWNAIAVSTLIGQGQSPFAQARFMAITQLAVFEAVNAITGDYKPYVPTPCFPSYPSNHGSAGNGAAEVLKRVYGEGNHDITMTTPVVPGVILHYTRFEEITDDISDARIYGGIHFRFDQEAGADLGRDVGSYVYRHNLRRVKHDDGEEDRDSDDQNEGRSHRRD